MISYNNFPRAESALVENSHTVMSRGSGSIHVVRFVLESKYRNMATGRKAMHFLYITVLMLQT